MRIKIVPVFDTFARIYFPIFVYNSQKSACTEYKQIQELYFLLFLFFQGMQLSYCCCQNNLDQNRLPAKLTHRKISRRCRIPIDPLIPDLIECGNIRLVPDKYLRAQDMIPVRTVRLQHCIRLFQHTFRLLAHGVARICVRQTG